VVNWLCPSGLLSKITVVPVMATVTALLRIEPPPEFFGTRSRIEPLSTFAVRPLLLKVKIVFAPSRVIVRSGNVSSERESPPVRTPVSSLTWSFKAAARGSALAGKRLTSRMIWVTRASVDGAPVRAGTSRTMARPAIEPTKICEAVFI
jgi:hypothetical protein